MNMNMSGQGGMNHKNENVNVSHIKGLDIFPSRVNSKQPAHHSSLYCTVYRVPGGDPLLLASTDMMIES